jgi:hypothetical protein
MLSCCCVKINLEVHQLTQIDFMPRCLANTKFTRIGMIMHLCVIGAFLSSLDSIWLASCYSSAESESDTALPGSLLILGNINNITTTTRYSLDSECCSYCLLGSEIPGLIISQCVRQSNTFNVDISRGFFPLGLTRDAESFVLICACFFGGQRHIQGQEFV